MGIRRTHSRLKPPGPHRGFILWTRRLSSKLLKQGYLEERLKSSFGKFSWSIWWSYSAIWSIPLTNVKWHSDPWPTVTSQPIRLSTNFMTLIPSLTFTDYEWFPWSICNGSGMPAGNAYPSGHLVPSPIVGLACAPIVETRFLELAMSLFDFSPRIPLDTFSILLRKPRSTVWFLFEYYSTAVMLKCHRITWIVE